MLHPQGHEPGLYFSTNRRGVRQWMLYPITLNFSKNTCHNLSPCHDYSYKIVVIHGTEQKLPKPGQRYRSITGTSQGWGEQPGTGFKPLSACACSHLPARLLLGAPAPEGSRQLVCGSGAGKAPEERKEGPDTHREGAVLRTHRLSTPGQPARRKERQGHGVLAAC